MRFLSSSIFLTSNKNIVKLYTKTGLSLPYYFNMKYNFLIEFKTTTQFLVRTNFMETTRLRFTLKKFII